MHAADLGDPMQPAAIEDVRHRMTLSLGPANAVWYSGLGQRERTRIARDMDTVTVHPRDSILPTCTSTLSWIGVLDGFVAVTKTYRDRRQATLAGFPPGGWFGEEALLRRELYGYEARALRRTVIARMPIKTFDWLLERSLAFNRYVMRQLTERLSQIQEDHEVAPHLDTDARISRNLGSLFRPAIYSRDGYHLRLTQKELADFCRVSRQRMNEALTRLERNGLIRIEYGGIRVLDLERLQQHPASPRIST